MNSDVTVEDGERSVRRLSRGEFVAPPRDDSVPAPRPGGAGYRAAKRAFDIVFSLAVIAVLAVPVALLCLAIVLDSPGAPFFRQERVGLGGRRIYIWKLRSMVPDAHSNPERYMTPEQLETWRREQKLDDDPRITRVGRFLRRTSLDELPQFINVLTGDLSVIGPRPVTLEETLILSMRNYPSTPTKLTRSRQRPLASGASRPYPVSATSMCGRRISTRVGLGIVRKRK